MAQYNFTFTGTGREYFKIWIVNILFTILTLGIYSAWATVRNKRYFYGNTWFANENFDYHATPKQILFGRVIAIALLCIYLLLSNLTPILGFGFLALLMLGSPWIIWRSMQFNARMSSYRNVRFAFGGSLKKSYYYLLLIPFAPILIGGALAGLSFLLLGGDGDKAAAITGIIVMVAFTVIYVMIPFIHMLFDSYVINNSQYGQGEFQAELDVGEYYIIYLKWLGLSFVVFIGFFLLAALLAGLVGTVIALLSGGEMGDFDPENMNGGIFALIGVGVYAPILFAGMFLNAYLKSRIRNYSFNLTDLDNKTLDLKSDVKARKLFLLYLSNMLMVIFSLGLAIPWAKVRLARYSANTTHAEVNGEINQYVTQQQNLQTSLGEEMGDAFDIQGGFEVGL